MLTLLPLLLILLLSPLPARQAVVTPEDGYDAELAGLELLLSQLGSEPEQAGNRVRRAAGDKGVT